MVKTSKSHLDAVKRLRNPEGDRISYLRLDKSERTTPFPTAAWEEIWRTFNPEQLTVYPEVGGLISKIAHSVGLSEDQIYLTAGSDLAIKGCYEAFVEKGSHVVYLSPTFAMVEVYGKLFDAKLVPVTSRPDQTIDVADLIARINEETSLVVIANPNSPTGTTLSIPDLERVVIHAQRFQCPVLVDEAYYYFHRETMVPKVNQYPNLLVCRTFSKACGLAGVRLGFLAGNTDAIELVSKWRPLYEVNTFAVHAGKCLLEHPEWIEEYVAEVDRAKEFVRKWGQERDFRVLPSGANFVNIVVGKSRVPSIVARCAEQKISLRGAGPHVHNDECVRISLGTVDQVKPVLQVIESVVRGV